MSKRKEKGTLSISSQVDNSKVPGKLRRPVRSKQHTSKRRRKRNKVMGRKRRVSKDRNPPITGIKDGKTLKRVFGVRGQGRRTP